MKTALPREHRRILESTVGQARTQAEDGAAKALKALAVGAPAPQTHATPEQKRLRVQLRAHGRALGDVAAADGIQATDHLVTEIAYEHWHRMLFARFLAESSLLMHPDGYPVSLADCKDDATTIQPPARSEWEVAGRYASAMLPNVFRANSPVLALALPLETEQALEALLAKLPSTVFQADDSLGWSYQFWQAQKKEDVQRQMKQAGTKVGADELPAVTQLFTEQYMVAFQLENALGAWMHSRHPRMALPVDMPYFRKMPDGSPAAGTFPAWPDSLATFTLLDPCLGSGHFLVSAFHYLVPLRCATEKLSVRDAVDRVLADNLYGLELDARCVEIAAFALALAAWRYPDEKGNALGYRALPRLNIACVGVAPRSKKVDWLKLAEGDRRLEDGMAALYDLFQKAPELGSLIDPKAATRGDLISAHWDELAAKLDFALAAKDGGASDAQDTEASSAALEARVTARGMVHASRILTRRYHLVMTNPPYLGTGQHGPVLKDFCEEHYKTARSDLANVFLERCLKLCASGGVVSFVMPQNWLFLKSYQKQREHLLRFTTWNFLARLGSGAFEMITGEVVNAVLLTLTHAKPNADQPLRGLDASAPKSPGEKALLLAGGEVVEVSQDGQLANPDARIVLEARENLALLEKFAFSSIGLSTSDTPLFVQYYWEQIDIGNDWEFHQSSPVNASNWAGMEHIVLYENGRGRMRALAAAQDLDRGRDKQGGNAWGQRGVAVGLMRDLPAALFIGNKFDNNMGALVPYSQDDLAALWCYCSSPRYSEEVRRIDQKMNVTNGTLGKVPFDLTHWQQVAAELYPIGLPKPYSDDPTQWIFHGHPQPATDPLQVAVARLLGYRWPAESDAAMELSDEARTWIARCKDLGSLVDDDGILCLPAVRGEAAAVDRLRALLAQAFGTGWTPASEAKLLSDAGCEGLPLAQWLRDKFFEQHVARFQKRPFIWHVWDGHKDGFSALLNYHTLTRAKLQTLIHTYLGDWITQQRRTVDAGGAQAGEATLKLAKAEALKLQLEAIAQGEKPFDIFVRWKPLHQQPIGWEPDLNDGVRMNIRPFVEAGVLRIPRAKLGIKWESDRGKDVASAPWFKLGPTYAEPEGTRINDHHLSLADKQAAREKAGGKAAK
jgi:hypothetical protein